MEMSDNHSNNYMPAELHVAQQRRRDKLRVQQFDDLQDHNNFQYPHSCGSEASPMILATEMLHFTSSHTLDDGPFPNIHPTRFIAPSSSDSFQQASESWVPSYGGNNDHYGRPSQFSAFPSQFIPQNHHNNQPFPVDNNGWENNGENNDDELPLIPHGLSLSLSSNQICEYQHHLGGGDPRELKPFQSASISSIVEHPISGNNNHNSYSSSNNQVPVMAGSSIQVHRNIGPLGPFTGYAAILKSSKFLKPAQSLLDEFFGILRADDESESGLSIPCSMAMVPNGSKDVSSMRLSCESYTPPDCHERKAELLHMQQEVCKRHKQYHQHMQMVISAFDSVPGLGNATPYISRSIKTISRHFRSLKNAISDQLKHIKRALGEDLSSPASFLKSDSNTSLKYDQNYVKARSSFGGPAHLGHQSHVWRPQRGLPERAVSVLRAWLFDHFLHPYPTDNDKQMLATETGLSRNQVSNWFINARVRLWKPMVEEIHMLETETGLHESNSSNDSVMSVIAKNSQAADGNHSGCKPPVNLRPCDDMHLEHLGPSTSLERTRGETNAEQLFYKCSRIDKHQIPANVDTSFIGFLPYQRRGLEMGGIGAVSLTLGLRHGSETNQQLQHQFLPQGIPFGGHVIHDFSG